MEARGRFWLWALAAMEERGLDSDAVEMDVVEMLERRVSLAMLDEVSWYRHVQNRVLAAEKSATLPAGYHFVTVWSACWVPRPS